MIIVLKSPKNTMQNEYKHHIIEETPVRHNNTISKHSPDIDRDLLENCVVVMYWSQLWAQ